ncbi:MAG: MATE family efflux transporter [Candidatus Eisenbacteria bacterium]|nr:MATE family efflux transporter [Candidatus Eisenbacteria bacterium]
MSDRQTNRSEPPERPQVDITEGNTLRNVLYMGIPSMIGFGAMTIYSLTDIYWVGRLGTAPVAAITLFAAIAWVLGSANQIVGTGSVALISRRFGEREYEATRDVIRQTLFLKAAIAVIMAAIGLLALESILGIMNADEAARSQAVVYGRIYFLGLPFMFSSYTIYTALRGVGDAPKAMYIMLLSTALNVGLDPVFIFGLDMGIAGAALATVLSATIAVLVGVVVLATGWANIRVPMWGRFRPRFRVMLQILKIGIPAGLNGILRSTGHWYVTALVATFGTVVVAAYGISGRILQLGILFAVGLNLGSSAIVGQNLGAQKKERARDAVVKSTLLVLGLTGILAAVEIAFARQILGVFTNDAGVIESGVLLVRIFAVSQILIGMHIVLSSAFWGSGHTWPPTIVTAIVQWAVQIPLILVVIHVIGGSETMVWWTMLVAAVIEVLLTYLWFRRGSWMHREV